MRQSANRVNGDTQAVGVGTVTRDGRCLDWMNMWHAVGHTGKPSDQCHSGQQPADSQPVTPPRLITHSHKLDKTGCAGPVSHAAKPAPYLASAATIRASLAHRCISPEPSEHTVYLARRRQPARSSANNCSRQWVRGSPGAGGVNHRSGNHFPAVSEADQNGAESRPAVWTRSNPFSGRPPPDKGLAAEPARSPFRPVSGR
jgi:hypothetical protein